jgi:hypothetical protein
MAEGLGSNKSDRLLEEGEGSNCICAVVPREFRRGRLRGRGGSDVSSCRPATEAVRLTPLVDDVEDVKRLMPDSSGSEAGGYDGWYCWWVRGWCSGCCGGWSCCGEESVCEKGSGEGSFEDAEEADAEDTSTVGDILGCAGDDSREGLAEATTGDS